VSIPFRLIFPALNSLCCSPFSLVNSLLALVVYWHVFNFAQHKHVTRLPLSCCVCVKKRSSVCDYIIHCSMQSTPSVINNLLQFLLMFPHSTAACNPSQAWQISASAVKCEGVPSVVLLSLGMNDKRSNW
jgi:hypothetical protein